MPVMTLAQVDMLVQQALALGLTEYEAAGVRDMLLMRAAQPDGGDKLEIAVRQMPSTRRAHYTEFLDQLDALGESMLARGRDVLGALSDDEWAVLLEDDEGA